MTLTQRRARATRCASRRYAWGSLAAASTLTIIGALPFAASDPSPAASSPAPNLGDRAPAIASFAATPTAPRLSVESRTRQDSVSFAADILPIFRARCAQCHGAEDEDGEIRTEVSLNLLEYERVMAGSEFGTVIEAGDPDGSFLLDMIVDGSMPETGDPVPEEEIALIRAWIAAGAQNN